MYVIIHTGFSDDGSYQGSPEQSTHGEVTTSEPNDLPPELADLPAPIKDHIDQMVQNDQELGTQLAAIDALMLSTY